MSCWAQILSHKGLQKILKIIHRIHREVVEPWKSLAMKAGWKDLAQQHVIPYVKGHKLLIVHDMVKWIVGSIVRREFRNHEPP